MNKPVQRDLFAAGPSKPSVDARRSMPKQRMVVEAFTFAGGPECEPRDVSTVPAWLRFGGGQ